MKNRIFDRSCHLLLQACFFIGLLAAVSQARAVGSGELSYQGYLTDSTGAPLNDMVHVSFALYNVPTGGLPLWTDSLSVAVEQGLFSVELGGAGVPFPLNLFDDPLWLGIRVEADAEMVPRRSLHSSGYAFKADDADSLQGQDAASLDQSAHVSDFSNPHVVTAAQTGAASSAELAAHAGDPADHHIRYEDAEAVAAIMAADGSGSGLNADFLDNLDSSAFVQLGADYGRPGVAADLFEGASTLTNRYVNEGQVNSINSAMIITGAVKSSEVENDSLLAEDLAANSVTPSEIRFSLNHTQEDINGGLISMTNSANGSGGNYPAGLLGQSSGNAGSNRVLGVLGTVPGLGAGSVAGLLPTGPTGVAGASAGGHGVAGVTSSHQHFGVYGESSNGGGVKGKHTNPELTAPGVFGDNEGSGVGVLGDAVGDTNAGVMGRAYGSSGIGIEGRATGAAGIGMKATSEGTGAAAVLSNTGRGPLLEASGGNSGAPKFVIFNRGTTELFNASHRRTIRIDPNEARDRGGVPVPDGGKITLYNSDGVATIQIDGDLGNDGRITTDELQITGGSDLSENFDVTSSAIDIKPGMLLSINPAQPGQLMITASPYDNKVAGIVSGAGGIKPGMTMGQKGTIANGSLPVALSGRVYAYADASQQPIRPGDLLTSSPVPGHAMKATDRDRTHGSIIGKAMTALDDGRGLVLVLVSLQ